MKTRLGDVFVSHESSTERVADEFLSYRARRHTHPRATQPQFACCARRNGPRGKRPLIFQCEAKTCAKHFEHVIQQLSSSRNFLRAPLCFARREPRSDRVICGGTVKRTAISLARLLFASDDLAMHMHERVVKRKEYFARLSASFSVINCFFFSSPYNLIVSRNRAA